MSRPSRTVLLLAVLLVAPLAVAENADPAQDGSQYAWAENAGWISFSCANTSSCGTVDYGVTIDPFSGVSSGGARGENLGWIGFASDAPPTAVAAATTLGDPDSSRRAMRRSRYPPGPAREGWGRLV